MKQARKKTARSANGRSSRHRRQGWAHVLRGLVLEGLGVAVLAFLFLTIQNMPAESNQSAPAEQKVIQKVQVPTHGPASGRLASTWQKLKRLTLSRYGQSGLIGATR